MTPIKLDITYDFDFELIGISSEERGYKLAWQLNHLLHIQFVREPAITIDFSQGRSLDISVYKYHTANDSYQLITNRGLNTTNQERLFLLPELHTFDYFLRIDNATGSIDIHAIEQSIRELPSVEHCRKVNASNLKSRENLLF